MAIDFKSLNSSHIVKPPILTVYGTGGIGKSFLAAGAPDPVFLCTEDGLGDIDVPNWQIRDYNELGQAFALLAKGEDHDFRTVVIDSLDHLEPMIWAQACEENKWNDIESPGYGKGYVYALGLWRDLLFTLKYLRDNLSMTIIMLAHHQIRRFDAPDSEPYDRYMLKLQEKASGLVIEDSDIVGFMTQRVTVQKTKAGFDAQVTRGTGVGQRVLRMEERPSFVAKKRYRQVPAEVDLPNSKDPQVVWAKLEKYIPWYNTPAPVTEEVKPEPEAQPESKPKTSHSKRKAA